MSYRPYYACLILIGLILLNASYSFADNKKHQEEFLRNATTVVPVYVLNFNTGKYEKTDSFDSYAPVFNGNTLEIKHIETVPSRQKVYHNSFLINLNDIDKTSIKLGADLETHWPILLKTKQDKKSIEIRYPGEETIYNYFVQIYLKKDKLTKEEALRLVSNIIP